MERQFNSTAREGRVLGLSRSAGLGNLKEEDEGLADALVTMDAKLPELVSVNDRLLTIRSDKDADVGTMRNSIGKR